jgi:phosphatidylinositol alpha-mannosyltransferase
VTYVEPGDVAGLAEALRSLWTDPGRREALSRAGRARARRFTWVATATKTLEVYRAALAEGSGSAGPSTPQPAIAP